MASDSLDSDERLTLKARPILQHLSCQFITSLPNERASMAPDVSDSCSLAVRSSSSRSTSSLDIIIWAAESPWELWELDLTSLIFSGALIGAFCCFSDV